MGNEVVLRPPLKERGERDSKKLRSQGNSLRQGGGDCQPCPSFFRGVKIWMGEVDGRGETSMSLQEDGGKKKKDIVHSTWKRQILQKGRRKARAWCFRGARRW